MNEKRMTRFLKLLEGANYKSVVLNPGPTMTYLTGLHFGLDERPKMLFLGKNIEPVLILPELEAGSLDNASFKVKPFVYGENPEQWLKVFKEACDYLQLDGQTIGVEPVHLRVLELNFLQGAAPKSKFVSASAQLDFLRMQKDEEEIAAMRKAARIAQNAFQSTISSIKA
ncbi:MAG: aminopeptidase P family N-terminal domain-containing protein, partial [Anaerolineaceae bacterium]|nr:aminopeptidase P family N-terminal domain-containing protein [Anaerolineaceae bacterium]